MIICNLVVGTNCDGGSQYYKKGFYFQFPASPIFDGHICNYLLMIMIHINMVLFKRCPTAVHECNLNTKKMRMGKAILVLVS
jgi:hypothetical protein